MAYLKILRGLKQKQGTLPSTEKFINFIKIQSFKSHLRDASQKMRFCLVLIRTFLLIIFSLAVFIMSKHLFISLSKQRRQFWVYKIDRLSTIHQDSHIYVFFLWDFNKIKKRYFCRFIKHDDDDDHDWGKKKIRQ